MADSNDKVREISLGDDFGAVVVRANGAKVTIGADGRVIVRTRGGVELQAGANDDARPKAGHEIPLRENSGGQVGAIESTGEHKGEIYGGIWSKEYGGDDKPIWFSAAPKVMDHYNAAAWAEGQGGSLPTRKQGDYLTTLKGKGGAFTEIFNRGGSFPAGYVWLAEPYTLNRYGAWCQRLSDGDQDDDFRNVELPVLCVRR